MGNGIGMPAHFYLHHFGEIIREAFDEIPYHVGSSLLGKQWRDVDVRLILSQEKWERFIGEDYQEGNSLPMGSRRAALEMAFDALGRQITGLPIDFQIQNSAVANKYDGPRSAIGVRLTKDAHGMDVAMKCARDSVEDGSKCDHGWTAAELYVGKRRNPNYAGGPVVEPKKTQKGGQE